MRDYIAGSKNENLIKILKGSGRYGVVIQLILALMYSIRRCGIGVSFHQSCIIFYTASFLAISGITAGSYTAISKYIELCATRNADTVGVSDRETHSGILPLHSGDTTTDPPANHYGSNKIYMGTIETINAEAGTADEIVLSIKRNLARIHGPQNLVSTADTANVSYALTGSITGINEIYIISVKIIDRRESRIIYMTSRNITDKNAIAASCKEIAASISGAVK